MGEDTTSNPSPEGVAVTDTGFKTHNARATTAHQTPPPTSARSCCLLTTTRSWGMRGSTSIFPTLRRALLAAAVPPE